MLWNEKYSDLMANYFPYLYDVACQASWRTSPVKWSPRAEGPTPCYHGLHLAHKNRIRIWIYSLPSDKENRIKITNINRLMPCFRRHFAMFWDSSQVRACCSIVQMNAWNITQHTVSLCGVIMGSVTSSMHSHDKTNESTLSYRCANHAIERCQSNYRKYCRITWSLTKTKWYGYVDHVGCIRVNFGQSTG